MLELADKDIKTVIINCIPNVQKISRGMKSIKIPNQILGMKIQCLRRKTYQMGLTTIRYGRKNG